MAPILCPRAFSVSIPENQLAALRTLLELSPIPTPFHEGTDPELGITTAWLTNAKSHWLDNFTWSNHEAYINQYPQYLADVTNTDNQQYTLHFVHIPSPSLLATPLLLLHGWPGSYIEFYPLIAPLLASGRFSLVIPSLPGYMYSSPPPTDKPFTLKDAGYLISELMLGLGYPRYVVHGGDLGAFIGRYIGTRFPGCVGVHQNLIWLNPDPSLPELTESEARLMKASTWQTTGSAYAQMHATKPATIAHALSASPLALLAWLGEKFLAWTDRDPPLEDILRAVTMWWITGTFPTSIYAYREIFGREAGWWGELLEGGHLFLEKPLGYSLFPKEIIPVPGSWAAKTGKMVFFRQHERGGHFPAWEEPDLLTGDLEEFVEKAWEGGSDVDASQL